MKKPEQKLVGHRWLTASRVTSCVNCDIWVRVNPHPQENEYSVDEGSTWTTERPACVFN